MARPDLFAQAFRDGDVRFYEIIEKNADAMIVVGEEGVIHFANPAAERLLGRPLERLLGQPFGIPVIPEETTEIDVPQGDGAVRVAEMRVVTAQWNGRAAYLASLRDVTERKQTQDSLLFSAEASRQLAGSLDYPTTLATVVRLAAGELADWATIELFGDDGLVHRAAAAHADPQRAELVERLRGAWSPAPPFTSWIAALQSGTKVIDNDVSPAFREALASHPERRRIVDELGCRALVAVPLVARGRTIGALVLASALPKRGNAVEIARAEDLAQRAAWAIDNARMYDDSQEALRRRDEFLAMLAHELRNPLAAVLNAAELIRRETASSGRLAPPAEVIERQGQHMARLLDDLLDISRLTRGKIALQRQVADLREAIRAAVECCRPLAALRCHELRVELPPHPLWVDGDPTRLEQVFANLLSNSVKYTPPGGKIELELGRERAEAVAWVRDNGLGISREDLPRIFELFVQVDRSPARTEGGLGIGLTLVQRLVAMHGGKVVAHSEGKGKGSQFVVRLPLARPASPTPRRAPKRPEAAARRVVLVEDNADSREMLRALLQLEGHQVEVAEDGPRGLETICRVRPEVALVDIGLPGFDGLEVARRARREFDKQQLKLVALTGYGQPEDRRRAIEAGFDEHLVKPVRLDDLQELFQRADGSAQ